MLKLLPLLLAALYALAMWKFSAYALRRKLAAEARPLDEPALEAMARRIGRAVEIPHLKAHVLPQEAFNALASPDGGIYLTEGVLRRHRMGEVSSEEVASIIAHELGHVALGHSKRRMGEMAAQNAARVGLVLVLGRLIPFIGGYIAVWIAGLLSALVTAKLSRKDEFEADAYAAALMRKAGLPVEAQARMFDKLAAMRPAGAPGAEGPLAWLMGHPAPEERAAAVRRLAAQWEGA